MLLMCGKTNNGLDFNAPFLTVPSEPDKLTLDHLEPQNPNRIFASAYFEHTERQRIVNSLGNIMLLDFSSNNKKNNGPMETSLKILSNSQLGSHWLTSDIKQILKENHSKNGDFSVPNENFFVRRAETLTRSMIELLRKNYN